MKKAAAEGFQRLKAFNRLQLAGLGCSVLDHGDEGVILKLCLAFDCEYTTQYDKLITT